MSTGNLVCRKCGATLKTCKSYLRRVNEKNVPGIWECAPNCNTEMSAEEAVLAAIKGKET